MISVKTQNRANAASGSFAVQDMFASIEGDSFLEIIDIFVPKEERGQGKVTEELKTAVEVAGDQLIITLAGISKREYPEDTLTDKEKDEVMNRLDKFYTAAGFVTINAMIGTYETVELYLYAGNESGTTFFRKLVQEALYDQEFTNCRRYIRYLREHNLINLDDFTLAKSKFRMDVTDFMGDIDSMERRRLISHDDDGLMIRMSVEEVDGIQEEFYALRDKFLKSFSDLKTASQEREE